MLYHGDRVFRIFFPGKTKPRLVAGKAYRKTVVLRQPRRGQTQMPARARRSNSPTARPASPRRKCTNWLRALRRINAPAVPGRHERRKSEWCRQPNLRTASLQPCVPGAARHLAHGQSPRWQADPPFSWGGCLPLCCPAPLAWRNYSGIKLNAIPGIGLKLFGFIAGSVFTITPEQRSASTGFLSQDNNAPATRQM